MLRSVKEVEMLACASVGFLFVLVTVVVVFVAVFLVKRFFPKEK